MFMYTYYVVVLSAEGKKVVVFCVVNIVILFVVCLGCWMLYVAADAAVVDVVVCW